MSQQQKKCLVSACLTGLCTRYDGQSKGNPACQLQIADYFWIPVCPEQLGGLPTPRSAAVLVNGDGQDVLAGIAQVRDQNGNDVSAAFIRGAAMVLTIAKAHSIECCFLKSGSPSCGLDPHPGVTAALLLAHGIEVVSF
ncbi:MAG: DUF523 domain-containing protein [Desulfobulbaceae bacterium]|jgi:uncharacterized protein YbbK (DUF523 family)|nr:DUF523 domain-containing protein [Desulfobulbaceae bacterium]